MEEVGKNVKILRSQMELHCFQDTVETIYKQYNSQQYTVVGWLGTAKIAPDTLSKIGSAI